MSLTRLVTELTHGSLKELFKFKSNLTVIDIYPFRFVDYALSVGLLSQLRFVGDRRARQIENEIHSFVIRITHSFHLDYTCVEVGLP